MEDSLSVGVVFHHEPMQHATQDSECRATSGCPEELRESVMEYGISHLQVTGSKSQLSNVQNLFISQLFTDLCKRN